MLDLIGTCRSGLHLFLSWKRPFLLHGGDTSYGGLLIFFSLREYPSSLSGPSREALKKSQTSHTWFGQERVQLLKHEATRFFSPAMLPANCEGTERFIATSVIFLYPAGCILISI
jgi:hypothetical protein